jgi:predicted phosphodiesterase
MPKKPSNGIIVKDYLSKFPNTSTIGLARKIYDENKESFISVENVRQHIKYYRGASGKKLKNKVSDKSFFSKGEDRNTKYLLPESWSEYPKTFKLPTVNKKILVLSDIHIPYHDVEAVQLAVEKGISEGCDTVYLNGDILDFFGLSFHEKDSRKRPGVKQEIAMAKEFFQYLRHKLPNANIYFKPGNHEHRLERYLVIKAPELLDCEEFKLNILLELEKFKIIFIDKRTKVYFGHLLVEHGDRMKGSGGVNPARTLFTKYKRHVLCGHFHRKSEHTEKIYDGKLISTFSTGCLCELEPEYFECNNHVHGMAIVTMNGDNFKVNNYLIENGELF